MRLTLCAPAMLALAPTCMYAADYLSAEQAQKLMFPDADRFERRDFVVDPAAAAHARPTSMQLQVAKRGDASLGYVVVDEVIGKFELISYAVGLNLDGSVRQIEVLAYRESHGHEIRLAAWRRQFAGKTAASALRLGEDIANISGATLSCRHVTDGVRRIVLQVDALRRSGRLT